MVNVIMLSVAETLITPHKVKKYQNLVASS
jgi:hypothetical protein